MRHNTREIARTSSVGGTGNRLATTDPAQDLVTSAIVRRRWLGSKPVKQILSAEQGLFIFWYVFQYCYVFNRAICSSLKLSRSVPQLECDSCLSRGMIDSIANNGL